MVILALPTNPKGDGSYSTASLSSMSEQTPIRSKPSSSIRSFLSLVSTANDSARDLSPTEAEISLKECHNRWVKLLEANPSLRVAVLGGGIYGCHFANVFQKACEEVSKSFCSRNKDEKVTTTIDAKLVIFEKDHVLFSQASGKNSFRIHKGFHYPRSGSTRRMCYFDHNKFRHLYPHFFQTFDDEEHTPAFSKVFAVAKGDKTKVDYDALRDIFVGAKYQDGTSMWDEIDGELGNKDIRKSVDATFHRRQMEDLGFNPDLIDGAFLVQVEPILYADRPRDWFTQQFTETPFVELEMGKGVDRNHIEKKTKDDRPLFVHQQPFDFVLNCTYNQAIPMTPANHMVYYDLCLSVIVAEKPSLSESDTAVSFGIFDGPFPSLEPYDFADSKNLPSELKPFEGQNLFQIFDVQLSSIAISSDLKEAYRLMDVWEEKKQQGAKEYQEAVAAIWDKCERFFPRLAKDFELAGTWFALKTKVNDENASRPLVVKADESVNEEGRFIQVFSSKLTSIFKAEECVLDIIEDGAFENTDSITENIILCAPVRISG